MTPAFRRRLGAWAAVAAVLVAVAAIRWRVLDLPLDRDEGEYAYMGQLLLDGVPPYAAAYHFKLPGIYAVYAAILALFGETPAGIHLGLLVVNAATIALVFVLARRLAADDVAAVVAAGVFGALSVSPMLFGLGGYAEHVVLLLVVAAFAVLARATTPARWMLSGLLLGAAVLMKQSAVVFAAGALAWLAAGGGARTRDRLARASWLAAGLGVPWLGLAAWVLAAGTFPRFWFWVVVYGARYATDVGAGEGWENLVRSTGEIAPDCWVPLLLAAAGVAGIRLIGLPDHARGLWLSFVLASLAGTAITLNFRRQYFLLLLPALAVTAGIGVGTIARAPWRWARVAGVALGVAVVAQPVWTERAWLFTATPAQIVRHVYGRSPMFESAAIADYIRRHSGPGDRIAVLGSEPQIYFYAHRRSASGYVYMYPLMDPHPGALDLQRDMVQQIEAVSPRFLVWVNIRQSWLTRPQSPTDVFAWFTRYQAAYRRVGLVEIGHDGTAYHWGDQDGTTARSDVWLMVFDRTPDAGGR